jgi:hypothetical protein
VQGSVESTTLASGGGRRVEAQTRARGRLWAAGAWMAR